MKWAVATMIVGACVLALWFVTIPHHFGVILVLTGLVAAIVSVAGGHGTEDHAAPEA